MFAVAPKATAKKRHPKPEPINDAPATGKRYRRRKRQRDYRLVVVYPDIHFPHADKGSIVAINRLCKDHQPEEIIQIGDLIDGKALGRWPKSPEEWNGLQDEFDEARTFWANLRTLCPHAKLIQLEGNHEERLQMCLWERPGLHTLRSLTIQSLMGLHEFGVKYFRRTERYWINKDLKLLAMHGNQTNQNAAYSAHNEMVKRRVSFIGGHTHRLGATYHTGEDDTLCSVESGHLTLPSHSDWLRGRCANWQQGFVVIHLFPTWFQINAIPIKHGRFVYDGKVYSCE